MIARIRKSIEEKDKGFTLIELLVVMIIIGILAAIAIPVFLNQRKKAVDTAAKADVSTLGKEIATYYVDGTGRCGHGRRSAAPTYTVDGEDIGAQSNKMDTPVISGTDDTDWCVELPFTAAARTPRSRTRPSAV